MFDDLPKGPTRPDGSPLRFDDLPPLPDGYQLEEGPWTKYTSARTEAPVTTSGAAKAIASGAAKGFSDIPSGLIALGNLLRKVDPLNLPGMVHQQVPVPDALNKISQAADNLYTPQNSVESGLKTAAEWAPAIASGPEGLAGKGVLGAAKVLAKRGITQAAIPAGASEGAGFVADQLAPEYSPTARVAAALLTGHFGAKGAPAAPITSDAAGDLATKAFDSFRSAPVHVRPDVVENAAKDIQNTLAAKGLKFAPANSMVDQYVGNTQPITLNQLQETRSLLGKAARRSDQPEGVAAMHAKQGIDALMDSLTPNDIAFGATALPQAMADLKRGRAYTTLARRLEALEGAQYKAKLNVDTSHHGDYDTAQRQQLRSLLISRQAMNKLEPWRNDMERITKGTAGVNTLKTLGTLTGGSGGFHSGPWWLAALLAEPFSGSLAAGAAAMPFVGMSLRKLQSKTAEGQVNALRSKIASASGLLPTQQPAISQLVTRALIASQVMNGSRQ